MLTVLEINDEENKKRSVAASDSCFCMTEPVIDPTHKIQHCIRQIMRCNTMHHFVTEMCAHVHISVTKWRIVGYEQVNQLWDLRIMSFTTSWLFLIKPVTTRRTPCKALVVYFDLHRLNIWWCYAIATRTTLLALCAGNPTVTGVSFDECVSRLVYVCILVL